MALTGHALIDRAREYELETNDARAAVLLHQLAAEYAALLSRLADTQDNLTCMIKRGDYGRRTRD